MSRVPRAHRELTGRADRRRPRGVAAVVVAVMLVMLCIVVALTVNAGHLYSVRGELQNAADAAAVAGAWELNGTSTRFTAALTKAQDFAGYHFTDTSPKTTPGPQVVPEVVQLGRWTAPGDTGFTCDQQGRTNADGYRFCRISQSDANAGWMINAVRVVTARVGAADAAGGGALPTFMNGLITPSDADGRTDVRAEAIAVNGSPCAHGCPNVPFTVQYGCATSGSPGSLQCGERYFIGLSDATHDTAGWTSLSNTVSVSSNSLCDIVSNQVNNCNVKVCDLINVGNGNNFTAQCGSAQDGTKQDLCMWFKPYVGKTMQIPIVSNMTAEACRAGIPPADSTCSYTGSQVVVGFATFEVTQVWCQGETITEGGCAQFAGGGQDSAKQCVEVKLLCDQKDPQGGNPVGCGWYGTVGQTPKGVR